MRTVDDMHDVLPTDDESVDPRWRGFYVEGVQWLPDGGEAAKHALETVYEGAS
jgi:hypothetical protein